MAPSDYYSTDDLIFTYDEARDVTIFIPTEGYSSSGFPMFEWDGQVWREREFAVTPQIQERFPAAYDVRRKRFVVLGEHYSSFHPVAETWEYDGNGWTKMSPIRSPSPRAEASLAYDSIRGTIILFGGRQQEQINTVHLRDTWEYDGVTWKKIETVHAPVRTGTMVFHRGMNRMIMCCGSGEDYSEQAEFWQFDGQDWTILSTPEGPHDRIEAALGYAASTSTFLCYGGRFFESWPNQAFFADTWELRP